MHASVGSFRSRVSAIAMLCLAIASVCLCGAVSLVWGGTGIAGASSIYRYFALGYQRQGGADFTGVSSAMLPLIAAELPTGWSVGSQFENTVRLTSVAHRDLFRARVSFVFGDYLMALHVAPRAGRLIDVSDEAFGSHVIVISAGLARSLFGGAKRAIGRSIYDANGLALRVVGVLPSSFGGSDERFYSKSPLAWIPGTLVLLVEAGKWPTADGRQFPGNLLSRVPVTGPSILLSVPRNVGAAEINVVLEHASKSLRISLPRDVTGFVTAAPYSDNPKVQHLVAQRIRIFFGLAVATLILAALNILILGWLRFLRKRADLRLEQVLGARRGYLLRRVLVRGLGTLLILLLGSSFLTVLGVLLVRHFVSSLASVLNISILVAPLAWILPFTISLVVLVEVLPLLLLGREHLVEGARTVSEARGDRVFGSVMLASEIALGLVMSVLAAWAITYAWRSMHQRVGFLDRPATFLSVQSTGQVFGAVTKPDLHKAQVLLLETLQVVGSTIFSNAHPFGFGPPIKRIGGYDLPEDITVGSHNASACEVSATPGWIEASGVRLLAGANFDAFHAQEDAVLLDERLATRLFGSVRGAVGRSVSGPNKQQPWHVIGVVAPVYLHASRTDECPVVFEDLRNSVFGLYGNSRSLVIAGTMNHAQRQILRQRLDEFFKRRHVDLTVDSMRTTGELRDWLAAQQITESRVFTAIALFAWGIALSGIFALLRLYLAQRRRLLAIESALGATPSRTYFSVVLGTLAVAGIGAIIALLLLPWLATQYALLSGAQVAPFGWATWIALAVLLIAVFLVAHFPARRAARAEPAESLHEL